MDNTAISGFGPGSISDLVRNGGDVAGNMTNDDLKGYGPGSIPDLARNGGEVLDGDVTSVTILGTPVTTATEDEEYDGFTVTASGGTEPYVYALVGSWPDGIEIDDETGEVSGTPTESGTFADLSVSVTDADDNTAQLDTFTLEVEPA